MFNSHEEYYWTLLFTVSPLFLRSVWLVKLLSTMMILRPRNESLHITKRILPLQSFIEIRKSLNEIEAVVKIAVEDFFHRNPTRSLSKDNE